MRLRCPNCKEETLTADYQHGYQLLLCSKCQGCFIFMEDLNDALGFSGMVHLKGMIPTPNRGLKCPNDQEEMRSFKLPIFGQQLAMDRCPECDSIWFHNMGMLLNDHGELRQEAAATHATTPNEKAPSAEKHQLSPPSRSDIRKLAIEQLRQQEINFDFVPPHAQFTIPRYHWLALLTLLPIKGANRVYGTNYTSTAVFYAFAALLLGRLCYEFRSLFLLLQSDSGSPVRLFALFVLAGFLVLLYEKIISLYLLAKYGENLEDRWGGLQFSIMCFGFSLCAVLAELGGQYLFIHQLSSFYWDSMAYYAGIVAMSTGAAAGIFGSYCGAYPNSRIMLFGWFKKPLVLKAKFWPLLVVLYALVFWLFYDLFFMLHFVVIPWFGIAASLIVGYTISLWLVNRSPDGRIEKLMQKIKEEKQKG